MAGRALADSNLLLDHFGSPHGAHGGLAIHEIAQQQLVDTTCRTERVCPLVGQWRVWATRLAAQSLERCKPQALHLWHASHAHPPAPEHRTRQAQLHRPSDEAREPAALSGQQIVTSQGTACPAIALLSSGLRPVGTMAPQPWTDPDWPSPPLSTRSFCAGRPSKIMPDPSSKPSLSMASVRFVPPRCALGATLKHAIPDMRTLLTDGDSTGGHITLPGLRRRSAPRLEPFQWRKPSLCHASRHSRSTLFCCDTRSARV
ncbi:hypothetical protein P153DRAFT_389582 [Dothidotthia symphoricarpi CBS 119687]|uniref:Uncharacterized protein n=1 Tax=Dothidotthia symphoricarpi CBS 119687 TaxID=1392245 RepID=A0A6A6A1M2_9PLEO|nr:uncharacterized protein P153DRAFT_389582 [Dothidotthia symphoricarpi CBS 119687]KAF2125426.1 hypothetical protein P153DRAFT_389582 [Dothidotthia symphoricarpi CBS 119687]